MRSDAVSFFKFQKVQRFILIKGLNFTLKIFPVVTLHATIFSWNWLQLQDKTHPRNEKQWQPNVIKTVFNKFTVLWTIFSWNSKTPMPSNWKVLIEFENVITFLLMSQWIPWNYRKKYWAKKFSGMNPHFRHRTSCDSKHC